MAAGRPVEDVMGVGYVTAGHLRLAGIETVEQLATATPEDIVRKCDAAGVYMSLWRATSIVTAARTGEFRERPTPAHTPSAALSPTSRANLGGPPKATASMPKVVIWTSIAGAVVLVLYLMGASTTPSATGGFDPSEIIITHVSSAYSEPLGVRVFLMGEDGENVDEESFTLAPGGSHGRFRLRCTDNVESIGAGTYTGFAWTLVSGGFKSTTCRGNDWCNGNEWSIEITASGGPRPICQRPAPGYECRDHTACPPANTAPKSTTAGVQDFGIFIYREDGNLAVSHAFYDGDRWATSTKGVRADASVSFRLYRMDGDHYGEPDYRWRSAGSGTIPIDADEGAWTYESGVISYNVRFGDIPIPDDTSFKLVATATLPDGRTFERDASQWFI